VEHSTPNLDRPLSAVKQAAMTLPERGDYRVTERDGRFVIETSWRTIIDPDAVRAYITRHTFTHNTHKLRKAYIMEHNPYTYEAGTRDLQNAEDLAGWLDRYDKARGNAAHVVEVGRKATSIKQARDIAKAWGNLLRECTVAAVTLDTDPLEAGRPQSRRPGCPAILVVELPVWHDHAGRCAVLYYVPTDSFMVDDDERPGQRKELASYTNGAGVRFVIEYLDMDADDVEAFENDGRRAVRATAVARRYEGLSADEVQELNAEAAAERMRNLLRS
jgi:hypothetical protein